ncbi:dolichol phosphate-mannose biosynthesis regulatory protein-like [Babylonia areolata]|uniref:dolichol phosphate-mannose biosynthesis regulatory protein-like n=1 Tax=Babylonia areolata TaxID=304850 RepID=UPI003FD2EFAB
MATGHDQGVGWAMVSLGFFIFVYYTVWVIILPFVEPGVFVHKLFPPRIYAIAGPLLAGVVALALIGLFVCYVSLKSKKKKS